MNSTAEKKYLQTHADAQGPRVSITVLSFISDSTSASVLCHVLSLKANKASFYEREY